MAVRRDVAVVAGHVQAVEFHEEVRVVGEPAQLRAELAALVVDVRGCDRVVLGGVGRLELAALEQPLEVPAHRARS